MSAKRGRPVARKNTPVEDINRIDDYLKSQMQLLDADMKPVPLRLHRDKTVNMTGVAFHRYPDSMDDIHLAKKIGGGARPSMCRKRREIQFAGSKFRWQRRTKAEVAVPLRVRGSAADVLAAVRGGTPTTKHFLTPAQYERLVREVTADVTAAITATVSRAVTSEVISSVTAILPKMVKDMIDMANAPTHHIGLNNAIRDEMIR